MKENIKTLQIIHLAITLGIVMAYIFIGNLDKYVLNFKMEYLKSEEIFYLLIPVLAIVVCNVLYKSMLSKITSSQSYESKFVIFRTASIIRWAILEGGAFAILFIKPKFTLFGLLLIVYLIFIRPTETSVKNDLNLN